MIGAVRSKAISLSYREETPTCRSQSYVDVMCLADISVSGFTDKLDRLTGTITYRLDWFSESGGRHAMTGTAELSRVARW